MYGMTLSLYKTFDNNITRTNIEINDDLIEQAIKISNFKTKKDVINEALKHYVTALKKIIAFSS